MTKGLVQMLFAVTTLTIVGLVAWWAFKARASPGPLHPSHERVVALQGGAGCAACHDQLATTMVGACIKCHTPIGEHLRMKLGLHGRIDRSLSNACEQCHREHLGDKVELVSAGAFVLAGVQDWNTYDHAYFSEYRLIGRHTELKCAQCHSHAESPALTDGQLRFLGLTQDCNSCHSDVHRGELGLDCAKCHGQSRPFKESPLFKHPETLPLREGHSGRSCSECHKTPGQFTGLQTTCSSCHDPDYRKTTKPSHALAGLGADCAACHGTRKWTQDVRFEHPKTFPLAGGHEKRACVDCHDAGAVQDRYAAFKAQRSCAGCHASPHPKELEARARVALLKRPDADTCAACHAEADVTFAKASERMTLDVHAVTGFQLTAPHRIADCQKCHSLPTSSAADGDPQARWRAIYPGRSSEACEACHQDPHHGQFARSTSQGRCLECHSPARFVPSSFDATKHEACGFALTGGHRAVACAACHKVNDGWRRFVPTPKQCADCHKDPHGGRFDRPGVQKLVEGRNGCARCHTTGSFEEIAWKAEDHGRWTGYPLTGEHAKATCRDCHQRPVGGKLDRAGATPRTCADCHADVHAGQFRVGTTTDCQRCHEDTTSFRTVKFDHQRDARFALDAQHEKLQCSACHRAYQTAQGSVVRFKPLGVTCAECHDPRRKGGDR